MTLEIRPASWARDAEALTAIRFRVFVEEQAVPEDLELDGEDAGAAHWLALSDGKPVGTLRLLRDGHIGRLAVLSEARGQGIGSALLDAALRHAREQAQREVYLHAQVHALVFYERRHFRAEGPEFLDAGILHRLMRLSLREQRELGRDSGRFKVADRAAIALDLANQCQRRLCILSNELEHELYHRETFVDAVSRLARRHRNTEIRLLIVDSRALVRRGHPLLDLQRRLSSSIHIRRVSCEPAQIGENYLLADSGGILCYTVKEPGAAWADYNNGPVVTNYHAQFDALWSQAMDDPELRALHL